MNTLLKVAVGAAIAGAMVAMLLRRRSDAIPDKPSTAGLGRTHRPRWISPLEEVTDEHAVWGGGSSGLN